jgi:ribonuclease Y
MLQLPIYGYVIASVAVGLIGGWVLHRLATRRAAGRAQGEAHDILAAAKRDANDLRKRVELEAREESITARQRFEEESERVRREQNRRQEAIDQRETNLTNKVSFLDRKEARLDQMSEDLARATAEATEQEKRLGEALAAQKQRLEAIAGMSADQAKHRLMDSMVAEARHAAARRVKEAREESERTARRQAQKILSQAVQRYAADHVAEETVSVVVLPNDEMKGRIIGREGRNIRAFEIATGVDVIIDDTPEAVIVSGFDPVRREVANLALQKLIKDGRIHPGRIEEIVEKTGQEVRERIREIGEETCLEQGLQNVHPDLSRYVGRLQYRSSYGQNLLMHSKEVAAIAAIIAEELGLDAKLARRCGFLHDIGKAADHEMEGPHAMIGGKLCRKFGESDAVVNAVAGHHSDVEALTPYTYIAAAADAASASRPGARRESLETYIKRLESLEKIAESFDGVDKSYAIQAGREIRILVDHAKVSDDDAALLAEEVSRRVEGELEYPGQIKVMVIRETRATAFAK